MLTSLPESCYGEPALSSPAGSKGGSHTNKGKGEPSAGLLLYMIMLATASDYQHL